MIRIIRTSSLCLIALGGAANAAEPWETPRPSEMTEAHDGYAQSARKVQISLPEDYFGYDPAKVEWDYQGTRMPDTPMSNMSVAALTSLLNGRYHIYSNGNEGWSAAYYAPNGVSHFCEVTPQGTYNEWAYDRYVAGSAFGLAGMLHWDHVREADPKPPADEAIGWPVIADSDSGNLATARFGAGKWHVSHGWLQNEYATVFSEKCPQMPRAANINFEQSGDTVDELARDAKMLKGFRVAFPNNPHDPLTAGMYYSQFGPE